MIIDNLFTLQENSEYKPGSPYDRGGADAWYHRGPRPHKIVDGQEVTLTDPAEIAQYHQGFQDEGVTGRHQGKQYDESQSGVEEGSSEETLTTNVVKQWEKMHRPDAEQQAAKDAWVAKAAKALTQPKKKMPKKGVAEDVGDQWSVECQGKEYKCNDETHAVNKARSLINYGGESAIIKQNGNPKYKWALGQKMEPVAEAKTPDEFIQGIRNIASSKPSFQVGDWVEIDPNKTAGWASSGLIGRIEEIYKDDDGEETARINVNPRMGALGRQTKMKLKGGMLGPKGSTLDLGRGVRMGGTHTSVPTSMIMKVDMTEDQQGVAEDKINETVTVRRFTNRAGQSFFIAQTTMGREEVKMKGDTADEAKDNLEAEIRRRQAEQTKVTSNTVNIDFNAPFAQSVSKNSLDSFWAKIQKNERGTLQLVIANPQLVKEFGADLAELGFMRSGVRVQSGERAGTVFPSLTLNPNQIQGLDLVANGRYVLTNWDRPGTDRDQNTVFDLRYDSTASSTGDKVRLREPAFTVAVPRARAAKGVAEAKPTRHSMPRSVWNTKSPQDQEFLLKQHPNLVITDKPRPVKPQREKINYGEIANKIEQVVGNTFPDGDPLDWLLPYMRRRWGTDHNAMQHLDRAARRVLGARNYYDYLETVWDQVADDELVPNVSHKNNPWRVSEARHVHTTKQDWMGLPNLGDPAKVDVQRDWKKPTTQTHCPGCYSQDIKTYSDGEKECNQCHKTWDVKGVAEGRFEEPLTGWHIVSRAHDQVVRGTPSFATQDQAQKYLMNKMFANHQDFKVVHTAGVAEETQGQCPPATQDITLNLKNRQKAIDEYGYGPLNPDLPNDKFWTAKVKEWNLDSAEEAKQSLCGNCAAFDQRAKTLDCIAQGIDRDDPQDAAGTIDAGDLGYCKFLKFKCASRRTCDAWVTGGPLTDHTDNAQSQLEEKWSNKYKRSINCDHPRGFSQRAHCAGRNKNEDHEAGEQRWVLYLNSKPASHYSSESDARRDAEAVTQRLQSQGQSVPKIEILPHQRGLLEGQDVDLLEVAQVMTECLQRDTQQALPALQTYMRRRWGLESNPDQCLVQAGELLSEDLRKWFREKWVRFNPQGKIMGPCARGSSQEGKPKCLPQSKAHSLGKRGRASAAARKRREDPNPERRGAARNVATKKKSVSERCWDGYRQAGTKRKGSKQVPNCVPVSEQRCPHCGGAMVNDPVLAEKQDACYHKVRSRYKVWPSAYASGALVQCRKRGAANWGNKSK